MANKYLLVPAEIYQGLTTPDTGNINLDFIRQSLENTKRERTNASAKNTKYNQELRRYLHLRREQEGKPINVAVTGGDQFAGALINEPIVTTPHAVVKARAGKRIKGKARRQRGGVHATPVSQLPPIRGISTSSFPLIEDEEDEVFEEEMPSDVPGPSQQMLLSEPEQSLPIEQAPPKFAPRKWPLREKALKISSKVKDRKIIKKKTRSSQSSEDTEMQEIANGTRQIAKRSPRQLIRRRVLPGRGPYRKPLRATGHRRQAIAVPAVEAFPGSSNQLVFETEPMETNREIALRTPKELIRRRVVPKRIPYPSYKKALSQARSRKTLPGTSSQLAIESEPMDTNQLAIEEGPTYLSFPPQVSFPSQALRSFNNREIGRIHPLKSLPRRISLPYPSYKKALAVSHRRKALPTNALPSLPPLSEQLAIEAPPPRRRRNIREDYDVHIVTEGVRSLRKRKQPDEEIVPKKKWAQINPRAILGPPPKNWAVRRPTQKDIILKEIKERKAVQRREGEYAENPTKYL
jgi:hypothetical protein